MSKTINTRISQKHDFEINWNKAVNFKPNAGELIIYDAEVDGAGNPLVGAYELVNNTKMYPSNEKDASGKFLNNRNEPTTTARIKVGDGTSMLGMLPFVTSPEAEKVVLAIQDGGTGATTAAQARANLEITPENIDAVPTSRTVNGKALSSNITITASDIGAAPAYTASTTDLTAGISPLASGTLHFVYE